MNELYVHINYHHSSTQTTAHAHSFLFPSLFFIPGCVFLSLSPSIIYYSSTPLFALTNSTANLSSMDPCPFVRILVSNLSLKFPFVASSKPSFNSVHPSSSSPCFCKIKFSNFPSQIATIPLLLDDISNTQQGHPHFHSPPTVFTLNQSDLSKLASSKLLSLKIDIYSGKTGKSFGFNLAKYLGTVSVPIDLKAAAEWKTVVHHNGWVLVGRDDKGSAKAELCLSVKTETDPRFVFEFGGEAECSPHIFQVQGNVKQPVFTCKFSLRSVADRNLRSRASLSKPTNLKSWLSSLRQDNDNPAKERKGWSITIHDLSGSPVAAASMATPFVPSPSTDRVSRSNPGAWLILRPGDNTWKPWGRLEAWRERGAGDGVGYKFELLPDSSTTTTAATTVACSTISKTNGGKFSIDMTSLYNSPLVSPESSGDLGSDPEALLCPYRGFVMSSTVKAAAVEVEVGVQHVTCTEDAAAFVALAAAMKLSMDACRLFSQKLRKEFR